MKIHYHSDHLGSASFVTNAEGAAVQHLQYLPYGELFVSQRNTDEFDSRYKFTAKALDNETSYTYFGARYYDSKLSGWLSVDPISDKYPSLSSYLYCANNPVILRDPNGEFFGIDSWISGFISGFFSTGNNRWGSAWNEANKRMINDFKIWGGLFASDNNKTIGGRMWEVASRFTFQLPQTIAGFATSHCYNTFGLGGGVESVDYLFGATVLKTGNSWGGVTMSNFIIGDKNIKADPSNKLFQHEYSHYLQRQSSGWFYLSKYGIPSLLSKNPHDYNPVEQDANARALRYFSTNISGFNNGDFYYNPILNYNQSLPFNNPINQAALNGANLHLSWYDFFMAPFNLSIIGIPIPGLISTLMLNQKY